MPPLVRAQRHMPILQVIHPAALERRELDVKLSMVLLAHEHRQRDARQGLRAPFEELARGAVSLLDIRLQVGHQIRVGSELEQIPVAPPLQIDSLTGGRQIVVLISKLLLKQTKFLESCAQFGVGLLVASESDLKGGQDFQEKFRRALEYQAAAAGSPFVSQHALERLAVNRRHFKHAHTLGEGLSPEFVGATQPGLVGLSNILPHFRTILVCELRKNRAHAFSPRSAQPGRGCRLCL